MVVNRVRLNEFVPAIVAVDGAGECRLLDAPSGRVSVLSFPDSVHTTRNVAVMHDSTGQVTGYSDVRGDLGNRGGPVTSVSINLAQGMGVATNMHAGDRDASTRAPVGEMLDSEILDWPRRWIDRVHRQCELAEHAR